MSPHEQIGGSRTSLKSPSSLISLDFKPSGPTRGHGGVKNPAYVECTLRFIEHTPRGEVLLTPRKGALTVPPKFRSGASAFASHSPRASPLSSHGPLRCLFSPKIYELTGGAMFNAHKTDQNGRIGAQQTCADAVGQSQKHFHWSLLRRGSQSGLCGRGN